MEQFALKIFYENNTNILKTHYECHQIIRMTKKIMNRLELNFLKLISDNYLHYLKFCKEELKLKFNIEDNRKIIIYQKDYTNRNALFLAYTVIRLPNIRNSDFLKIFKTLNLADFDDAIDMLTCAYYMITERNDIKGLFIGNNHAHYILNNNICNELNFNHNDMVTPFYQTNTLRVFLNNLYTNKKCSGVNKFFTKNTLNNGFLLIDKPKLDNVSQYKNLKTKFNEIYISNRIIKGKSRVVQVL